MTTHIRAFAHRLVRAGVAMALGLTLGGAIIASATTLSDQPVFSSSSVPGNLALALSVEWPTASRTAHVGAYTRASTYLGYFDPNKCYLYQFNATANSTATGDISHFYPAGLATSHTCTGADDAKWSGNFLNWASTATIDPFRWAMTGGRRVVDTTTETILEKAWHSGQGGLFNDRALTVSEIAGATPFNGATSLGVSISGRRFKMRLNTSTGSTDYTMRVKVCDPSPAAGGVEANCKAYGSNYKPEGLIQQYAQKIRFSAFGYLNDDTYNRDGGVLRARQKFVGPTYPVPGQAAASNSATEWNATTGQFNRNPDSADATATQTATGVTVSDSGVMNYLNEFGQLYPGNYKSYDPVNELYYAALRYYRNLGDVSTWSSTAGAPDAATKRKWVDGFPVITNWGDPVQYACQRNFVLGIGDIYTHGDKNVPGNTLTAGEPTVPTAVSGDTTVSVITSTNKVKSLQGMGANLATATTGSSNSTDYMAGLAYDANTKDIRVDLAGKQTVQTYWVDVLEAPFVANNKFYLAAKFGGLDQKKLPAGFDPYTFAGTIPLDWWSTNGELLPGNIERPDNYFAAGRPDTMVTGLTQAFERISNQIEAYTTSFSLSSAQISSAGAASFAAQYDSRDWTGTVTASEITFAANGTPSQAARWSSTDKLATQLAGAGWDTNRRIATWNGSAGAPFRIGNLTAAQAAALDTGFVTGDDRANYLNYLRGDRSQEKTATDATKPYRLRSKLLGDIANAKVTPVGPPDSRFSNTVNPGYAAFKTAKATRPTMVYAAANDGMLHAFNGALTGVGAGVEQFAYVPSATFQGPSSPATPQLDGLAYIGHPSYQHRYYVDATPKVFDVDLNSAAGTFTTTSAANSRWRSLLVGGMGKGGKSYYALDVTDPGTLTDETTLAGKVLWEFTDPTMGFSFGTPLVVKTRRYGWVVVLTSGYNNSDGNGYLYFVNPETGALLQKVSTGAAANGMTHAAPYIQDYTDGTADAIYVGDLDGQLWRFDVTAPRGSTGAYPAPTKLAALVNASGQAQPITTTPLIEVHPTSKKRFVMVGTGQLLDSSDISSAAAQSFYAIIDGNTTAFRPADATMPVTRAQLTELTNLTTGVTLPVTSMGWFMELGATGGTAWRLVQNPIAYNGVVDFVPLLTVGDACSPSGASRLYSIDFGTGKTQFADGSAFYFSSVRITDIRNIRVDGKDWTIGGKENSETFVPPKVPGAGSGVRLLNWREVPTVD